jgi:hypothetical protein
MPNKNNMKFYTYLLLAGLGFSLFSMVSCSRFLEQPSGSIVTVDSVFNTPDNAMRALWQTYASCVVNGFITGDGGSGLSDAGTVDGFLLAASDEGDQFGVGGRANAFNAGTWNATNTDEFSISRVQLGMRNANIFLENVDNVPFVSTAGINWTPELKAQTIAEVKVLRAMMHYEMMIRFGGIPISDAVPKVRIVEEGGISKAVVTPSGTRRSLKSTVDFIVRSCDEAVAALPNAYPSSDIGRMHKGAALCLKAVTLMYAASPLVNTNTPPVPFGGNDSLLCLGSADPNRWVVAATANKAVIDWSQANGYILLDDPLLGKSESYNYATGAALDPRNKEILLYDKSHGQQAGGANVVRWGCPIYFSWGNTVMALPINFITKTYRDVNGNDITIPTDGTYTDFKAIMRRMEPRFHAVAWWPGSPYTKTGLMNGQGGNDTAKFVFKQGSVSGNFVQIGAGPQLIGNGVPNGIHQKKFINLVNAVNGRIDAYWPIFRLPEFYLNYAEALNEISAGNTEIYTVLNPIRLRGGLPALAPGNATYNDIHGNQAKTREYIRRERAVELYGEEHRFFDVRRWKIAGDDGVMKGQFFRNFLYQNSGTAYVNPTTAMTPAQRLANDNRLSYKIEPFETRVWQDKMYFFPFPQSEVNRGFLIQNPGW